MQRPPVLKLSDDVLWHIFNLNSPEDESFAAIDIQAQELKMEGALVTARRTSQVCSNWRAVILSSSSVWANAFDLWSLDQDGNNWRDEVLTRTKSHPLSIYGNIHEGSVSTDFFFSVVENNWHRLRRVAVLVNGSSTFACDPQWRFMERPTSSMEIFIASFRDCGGNLSSLESRNIFSHIAPRLHTLRWCTQSSSSFGTLRHLEIESCNPSILHLLSGMTALEDVILSSGLDGVLDQDKDGGECLRIWEHLPTVHLPRLKFLEINAKISTLVALICHILPPQDCTLRFGSIFLDYPLSPWHQEKLRHGFTTYYRNFLNQMTFDTLSLDIYIGGQFEVLDVLSNDEETDHRFAFYLADHQSMVPWQTICDIFIQPLSVTDLSTIKTFQLTGLKINNPPNFHFTTLLYSLVSTETLHCDPDVVKWINDFESRNDGCMLFPRLDTLAFSSHIPNIPAIVDFISRRRKAGIPLSFIDFSTCFTWISREDLLLIQSQSDLEVVWSDDMRMVLKEMYDFE